MVAKLELILLLTDLLAIALARDATTIATLGFIRHDSAGEIGDLEVEAAQLLIPHVHRAVTIGRPMASSEPKLMSRISAATSRPMPSELNWVCSAPLSAKPASSTCRSGRSTFWPRAMSAFASAFL